MQSNNENTACQQKAFLQRFSRQTAFAALGAQGQLKLAQSSALVVGMGGLGSWTAEYLVRAGIGSIRIADDDTVELSNLHRQALYVEQDAAERRLKVDAAAHRLRTINSACRIEVFPERIDVLTMNRAADQMALILDGTDNYETRFLLNDYAVKHAVPWIFAGVSEAEGQLMTIVPGKTPCLRCLMPAVPPCCANPNSCCRSGVVGAVVSLIAAHQAIEAIKILSGNAERINPNVLKYNFWENRFQVVELSRLPLDGSCPCCGQKDFTYLEP